MIRISSVTDYILKLEKLNQESREKIDSLKKLFLQSEEEKIAALNELNAMKNKNIKKVTFVANEDEVSSINLELADHLLNISARESNSYKANAFSNAAAIIAKLPYEVTDGESCAKRTKGIGPSIAAKIDEFLENYYDSDADSDYEYDSYSDSESIAESDDESDAESVASNSTTRSYEENCKSATNEFIAAELIQLANLESKRGQDPFRIRAYERAAASIRDLDFEVCCGADVSEGPRKVPGIGKSISNKIDEILQTGTTKRAMELSSR
jgi:hypothetical protein